MKKETENLKKTQPRITLRLRGWVEKKSFFKKINPNRVKSV